MSQDHTDTDTDCEAGLFPNGELPAIITRDMKRDAAERELRMRRRVYPRMVDSGALSEKAARLQIAIMEAIVTDYQGDGP